jgi:hypothetical protein
VQQAYIAPAKSVAAELYLLGLSFSAPLCPSFLGTTLLSYSSLTHTE